MARTRFFLLVIFTLALPLGFASVVFGAASEIAAHRDWIASKDGNECWSGSSPISTRITQNGKVTAANRGPAVLFITYNKDKGVKGEVSYKSGFPMKEDAYLMLEIDNKSYRMISEGEWAWSDGLDKDKEIIRAMRSGERAVVTSQSQRGKTVADTFSLSGFTAATQAAERGCK